MTEGYVDAGRLVAEVVADTRGLGSRLRSQLASELRGVEANVKVALDGSGLKNQLRALARNEDLTVAVRVTFNGAHVQRDLNRMARAANLEVPVGVNFKPAVIKAQLRAMSRAANLTLPVKLGLGIPQVRRELRRVSTAGNLSLPVKLNIDTTGVQAQLTAASTLNGYSVDVTPNLDTTQLAARLAAAIQAAVSSVNLPNPNNPNNPPTPTPNNPNDPNNPVQATRTWAEAQRELAKAMRTAERAALAVDEATRKVKRAERDAGRESEQYRRALYDLADAQDRQSDSANRGHDALHRLRQNTNRPLNVDVNADTADAERRLRELTRKREVTIEANVDVDRSKLSFLTQFTGKLAAGLAPFTGASMFAGLGISAVGAVGALGGLAAAIAPVVNNLALLPAAAAAGGVAIATLIVGFQGLGEAIKALTEKDLDKWNEAIKGLTPAARDVALAMYQIQPALTSLRQSVQESLLKGVGGDMRTFAQRYLGAGGLLGRALTSSASSWNSAFRDVFAFLNSNTTIPVIAQGLRQVDETGKHIARTFRPLTNIFVQLFAGGMPFVTRMADGLADLVERFSTFLGLSRQSGALNSFFERGIETAGQLWRILRDLGVGIKNFFLAGQDEGKGMLDSIEKAAAEFREFTTTGEAQEKFAQFFRDTRLIVQGLGDAIEVIADLAKPVLGFFSSLSEDTKKLVAPALLLAGAFGTIVGAVARIFGAVGSLVAARTMVTAANIQAGAAATMLAAARLQAGGALGRGVPPGGVPPRGVPPGGGAAGGRLLLGAGAVTLMATSVLLAKEAGDAIGNWLARSGFLGEKEKREETLGINAAKRRALGEGASFTERLKNPVQAIFAPHDLPSAKKAVEELKVLRDKEKEAALASKEAADAMRNQETDERKQRDADRKADAQARADKLRKELKVPVATTGPGRMDEKAIRDQFTKLVPKPAAAEAKGFWSKVNDFLFGSVNYKTGEVTGDAARRATGGQQLPSDPKQAIAALMREISTRTLRQGTTGAQPGDAAALAQLRAMVRAFENVDLPTQIKNAEALLKGAKVAGLTEPQILRLKTDIADWKAKRAIVLNDMLLLSKNPVRADVQFNLGHVQEQLTTVRTMLKDPKLTTPDRIRLTADLTQLEQAKLRAQILLKIDDRTVAIKANIQTLEETVKAGRELLKTNLPPEMRVRVQLTTDAAQAELDRFRLEVLDPAVVNPKVITIQGNITDAQSKIDQLKAELPKATGKRRVEIEAEITKYEKSVNGFLGHLALLPGMVNSHGVAVGDSWAMALAGLEPKSRLAGLKAGQALLEGMAASGDMVKLAEQMGITGANSFLSPGGLKKTVADKLGVQGVGVLTPKAFNERIGQAFVAQSPAGKAIAAMIAATQKEIRASAGAGKVSTGTPAGDKAFTSKTAEKAAREDAAADKRRQAARERAARAAAAAAAAAEKRRQAVSEVARLIAEKGFIQGVTGTVSQIKSMAAKVTGLLKTSLGKAGTAIATRLANDTFRLRQMAAARDAIVKKLTDAQQKLAQLTEDAARVRGEIADKIRGTFDVLDTSTGTSAQSMIDRLTKAVDDARKFTASIALLKSRGLANELLGQLAAGGPAGQATADALTAATGEQLATINRLYGDLSTQADTGGRVVADALYGAGIAAATGLVNGLLSQKKAVEASMTTVATALTNAIKAALKIKSPSLVLDQLGKFAMLGLSQGIMGQTAGLTNSMVGWATGALNSVRNAFTVGVAGIGAAWGGLAEATKAPVRLVIDTAINGGIIAAYNAVAAQFGIKPAVPFPMPKGLAPIKRSTGGPVWGAGTSTSDSIPALLSNDEHVLAAKEVKGLGGHGAVEAIRAIARKGGKLFAGGGALSGSGPATFPSMVAWLKKHFPFARASTYQPSFGYHRSPPGGYAADIFTPDVLAAGPMARSLFEGIRSTFKPYIQELIYSHMGGRQVWSGRDHTFTGSVVGGHYNHIHWSMLADGFTKAGMGLIGGLIDPLKNKISGALAGIAGQPGLASPFGQMLAGITGKLGTQVATAGSKLLSAAPGSIGDVGASVTVPAFGGSRGANIRLAEAMLSTHGWAKSQISALIKLWDGESNWNHTATNPSSGAYGIPQSLPANKMASAGPDWRTNPATQIKWGLGYIKNRYGSPADAYSFWLSQSPHWYDSGGMLEPGGIGVNGTRKPEAVFTGDEFERMISALNASPNETRSRFGLRPLASVTDRTSASAGSATGAAPVINIYPRASQSEAEIARMVSRELAWQGTSW
jgi:hypothetical protein